MISEKRNDKIVKLKIEPQNKRNKINITLDSVKLDSDMLNKVSNFNPMYILNVIGRLISKFDSFIYPHFVLTHVHVCIIMQLPF